jgi:catecholate siderophore receptor
MLLANSPLVWATCLALNAVTAGEANAEESADQQVRFAQAGASQLRALTVDQPTSRVQRRRVEMRRNENTRARRIVERIAPRLRRPAAPQPAPVASAQAGAQLPADTQDARTGTAGVYSNSTAIATKTNTPLINIPQSVSVLTKSFIQDHGVQNLNELTRYVPGIAIHQGEGNRDELVIRGVDSSANFFVNGFRDDVQIFRDLYNTQSIEILKGPSALTFGRGAGGGLVNRTLKEADWSALKEVMLQTGSYYDRRAAIDIDQPVNENVASA